MSSPDLPDPPSARSLRKATPDARRQALDALAARASPGADLAVRRLDPANPDALEFADVMVENAWGLLALPLGLGLTLRVDGRELMVPMATEEPSVIAAASYAGTLTGLHGGFSTWAAEALMKAHVYIQAPGAGDAAPLAAANTIQAPADGMPSDPAWARTALGRLEARRPDLDACLKARFGRMASRGGGFRSLDFQELAGQPGTVRLEFQADVQDAMGANLLNTAAEDLRPLVEAATGGRVLMAILSNNATQRLARASFRLPVRELKSGPWRGLEHARRICAAAEIAQVDPDRAVTHNKGIMNGITALALATGNDTRALEAAVHAWAGQSGRYRGLSTYRIEDDCLCGELEAPLCLATVGGAAGCHPQAAYNRALLGNPDARQLARIAAALGLAQNLAALMALTGEGIQGGHMRLHQRRLDWQRKNP